MLLVALLLGYSLRAAEPTKSQKHFAKIAERNPTSLVMATPTGAILSSETQWKGHCLTLEQAYPLVKRGNVFLVEPLRNYPPLPFPVTKGVVASVRVNGSNEFGVFVTGRKVVIP